MIKFIRQYKFYGSDWFDIVYTDGKYITRVRTCLLEDLPKTAQKFIAEATRITEQEDRLHGHEIIYEVEKAREI